VSRAAEIREFVGRDLDSPDPRTLRAFCVAGARWERVRDEVAHDRTPAGATELQKLTTALEELARRLGLSTAFSHGLVHRSEIPTAPRFLVGDPARLLR
jgi:hypothetical protein